MVLNKPNTIIIVPCYNEEDRLAVGRFNDFIAGNREIAFLFVDDGSTDNTADILRQICADTPDRCEVLRLEKNSGKAEAVRRGFLQALAKPYELIGYWDADLATPLTAIPLLRSVFLEKPSVEIVCGSRVMMMGRDIHRKPVRHYLGRCFATFASIVLRLKIYDTQCGAKLFRNTPTVRKVFEEPFISRWIFDVEMIARWMSTRGDLSVHDPNQCIYEYPLPVWHDVGGSKVRAGHFVKAAIELYRVYRRYSPSRFRIVRYPQG